MSYFVSPFLCPNYEDNEHYGSAKHYLKNWPDMWPEEKYAEGALWRERQEMLRNIPSWTRDNLNWWRCHMPEDADARRKQRMKLERVLASLACKHGWQKRVIMEGWNPITEIFTTH